MSKRRREYDRDKRIERLEFFAGMFLVSLATVLAHALVAMAVK